MAIDALTRSMLGLTTGLQATALAGHNAAFAMDSFSNKKKKKNNVKRMIGLGVGNIIGTSLIGAQAGIIGGL